MPSPPLPSRIDWTRIFDDVRLVGYTTYEFASLTGIPKSTLLGYKNLGKEPDHWRGEKILKFWCDVTGNDAALAPRQFIELSAAAFRR